MAQSDDDAQQRPRFVKMSGVMAHCVGNTRVLMVPRQIGQGTAGGGQGGWSVPVGGSARIFSMTSSPTEFTEFAMHPTHGCPYHDNDGPASLDSVCLALWKSPAAVEGQLREIVEGELATCNAGLGPMASTTR